MKFQIEVNQSKIRSVHNLISNKRQSHFVTILLTSVSIQECFIPGSEEMEDDPIEDVDRNLTSCLDFPSVRW